MEKNQKGPGNNNFGAINIAGLNVVKIGDFIISDSRIDRSSNVWVRREDSLEGGEFTINQINDALNYLFKKYF